MSNMPVPEVIATAQRLLGGTRESSAQECLRSAIKAQERGDSAAARVWARKSIAYSVGVFHPAYREVAAS